MQKAQWNVFGVIEVFYILFVVVVTWLYTDLKNFQTQNILLVNFIVCISYVNKVRKGRGSLFKTITFGSWSCEHWFSVPLSWSRKLAQLGLSIGWWLQLNGLFHKKNLIKYYYSVILYLQICPVMILGEQVKSLWLIFLRCFRKEIF